MHKHKLIISISIIIIISFLFPWSIKAACSSRQQSKICNTCKLDALSSPLCMSTESCPECSKCILCSEIEKNTGKSLKSTYILFVDLKSQGVHSYKLSIESIDNGSFQSTNNSSFKYTVDYLNEKYDLNGIGLITPSAIHFELPAVLEFKAGTLSEKDYLSLHCIAVLDNGSISKGTCVSLLFSPSLESVNQIAGELIQSNN